MDGVYTTRLYTTRYINKQSHQLNINEIFDMARAYVNLIIAGRRKYSTVPSIFKEEVKAGLEAAVGEKRITSEKLAELLAA